MFKEEKFNKKKIFCLSVLALGMIIPINFGLAENNLDSVSYNKNIAYENINTGKEESLSSNEQGVQEQQKNKETETEIQEKNRNRIRDISQVAIEKRLQSMENFRTALQNEKLVSQETKININKNLDNATQGIKDLLKDIESEEDLEKTKALAQKIVEDYKIYSVELPKNRGLTTASILKNITGKIDLSLEKINSALNGAKKNGVSTAMVEKDIIKIREQMNTLKNEIGSAEKEFSEMEIKGDGREARNHLDKGKTILKNSQTEIINLRNQLKELIPELKELISSFEETNKNSIQ